MQVPRSIVAISLLWLIVAACGGGPAAATQAPGGGSATQAPGDGGGTATQAPVATLGGPGGGGGGGNGGGGSGTMHIEVSGPVEASGDFAFFSIGSRFGGDAGTQLNFTNGEGSAIAGVSGVGGTWIITLTSETMTANSQTCELKDWNVGATSASGSFDCKDGFAVTIADSGYHTGVNLKGNFTANQ